MRVIRFLLKRSGSSVFFIAVFSVIAGLSNAASLALINRALHHARPLDLADEFLWLCAGMIGARTTAAFFLNRLSSRSLFDLRMDLSRKILATPLRQIETLGTPRLLAAMTEDVLTIITGLVQLPVLCRSAAVVAACIVYMMTLSWRVFLFVFVFLLVLFGSYRYSVDRAARLLQRAREEWDTLVGHFRSLIEGIKELKLHQRRRHAFYTELVEPSGRLFEALNIRGMTINAAALSWGQTLSFVVIALLVFGAPLVTQTTQELLVTFTLVILYILGPLEGIVGSWTVLSRANISMSNIDRLGLSLDSRPAERDCGPDTEMQAWERIELRDVTHSYRGERDNTTFTLGPIRLALHPGELIFLVGGNGSGKTTLAKLLMGLYVPESGEIRLDGQLVTDEERDHYRQRFSAVFFDFYLFDRLLGFDSKTIDDRARDYLLQLKLDHKVTIAEGRLSTTHLSQGQRKRLALLTAYLEDRPVYVFDEWAADQDPAFKQLFYNHLLPDLRGQGKTVIAISHDDRYYEQGDRLIKLESGQIAYDGPPPGKRDRERAADGEVGLRAEAV